MSRNLVVLFGMSLGVACGGADGIESPAAAQTEQTLLFASIPYRGVNLASAEFGVDSAGNGAIPGVHGKDYVYPDPAYAAGYASADYYVGKRMNTFRLPFRWERLQPTRNQAFSSAELERLRTTVRNLKAKGAVVLLDPHNYARYGTQVIGAGIPNSHFADFWARLASEFKNDPNVIFGLMNEPYNMPTEQWVNAANAAIAAIRNVGATNLILVPGNAWSGAHSWTQNWYGTSNAQALMAIRDPANNYAIEVHQYLDANYSGTSVDCPSAEAPARSMQAFTDWLRRNGKKGFLGEFSGGNSGTCLTALDNLLNHLEQNRDVYLGWTYWAGGPWWGNGLSLEPSGGRDKPQMDVLERHLTGNTVQTPPPSSGNGGSGGSGSTPPPTPGSPCSATYEAEHMTPTDGGPESDGWNLWTWGHLSTVHRFAAQRARVTVRARGTPAAGEWPRMTVQVGGKVIGRAVVGSRSNGDYGFSFDAEAGDREIRVSFDNDLQLPDEDRNLIVDKVMVACEQACQARTIEAETMSATAGAAVSGGWNLWTWGYLSAVHDFSGGPTRISVTARGTPARGEWPRMTLSVAGSTVGTVTVRSESYRTYTFDVTPNAGSKQIRLRFDNDYLGNGEDRNLIVDKVVIACP